MVKKELITKATQVLKNNYIKKPVQIKKNVFHISDDEGNSADFVVKQQEKNVIYTFDDVSNILDALVAVIENSLQKGEEVSIRGFGTFGLSHRKSKLIRNVTTGELSEIGEHFVPRFQSGYGLKVAAKMHEVDVKTLRERATSAEKDVTEDGGEA